MSPRAARPGGFRGVTMPAVATQLLADLDDLAALGPLPAALGTLSDAVKLANLRRASGEVLAAYGKRFPRTAGASFVLAKWGDFTKGLVVDIAAFRMLTTGPRGLNPTTPKDGGMLVENYKRAQDILNEIVDLTNSNPRMDPDAVGGPDDDDMGSLSYSEGGPFDEADAWAKIPGYGGSCGGCH
jgi:hypothetical protein